MKTKLLLLALSIVIVFGCNSRKADLYPYKITIEQDDLDFGVRGDFYGLRGYKRSIIRDTVMAGSDIEAYTRALIKAESHKFTIDKHKETFGESKIYHIAVFDSLGNHIPDKLTTQEIDSINMLVKNALGNLN